VLIGPFVDEQQMLGFDELPHVDHAAAAHPLDRDMPQTACQISGRVLDRGPTLHREEACKGFLQQVLGFVGRAG